MKWPLPVAFALSLLQHSDCTCQRAEPRDPTPICRSQTHAFLTQNRPRYLSGIAAARRWLDRLDIDPIALRERGVKGKKKLVEQLDGYGRLLAIAEPADRPALMERIRRVVAPTYESRFHDMLTIDDTTFKQDATSYLRGAVLMERLGLDTTLYREEIRKVHPRLNAHMTIRGPHQRRAFHWYYEHFGLEEPFPLAESLKAGVIARRLDPARFSNDETYDLTHEVFVPYEFGDRRDVDPFDEEDKMYLRRALDLLIARYVERRDPDLLAELVSCMRLLRFVEEPAFRKGLGYLLDSQNPDGSFGNRRRARRAFGDLADEGMILHTTMVAVDALSIAFHEPWNRDQYPGCATD